MHKKILAICAALVALAAVPAMASANATPHLVDSAGATVPTGTPITAVDSENAILTTPSGNVTCTNNHMAGKLATNSGKLIEGNIESASFKGEGTLERCKSTISILGAEVQFQVTTENLPWCLSSKTDGEWSLRGGGCSAASKNLRFTLHGFTHSGSVGSCTYERATVGGTNNLNSSPLILKTGANQTFTRVSGAFFCPAEGTLHAGFEVKTAAGGALKIT